MSIAEAERFAKELETNKPLLNEVIKNASGVKSVVDVAKAHGYDVTVEEAKQYMESRSPKELTDEQLDAVAGGKGGVISQASTVTITQTVQTAVQVTTAVQTAEVATTAAAVTEVVAVAAVVFT